MDDSLEAFLENSRALEEQPAPRQEQPAHRPVPAVAAAGAAAPLRRRA